MRQGAWLSLVAKQARPYSHPSLSQLKVLYVANNLLKDYRDLDGLPGSVEELSLLGNPVHEVARAEGPPTALGCTYRLEVLRRAPGLKKLDGVAVEPEEREAARAGGGARTANPAPSRGGDGGGAGLDGPRAGAAAAGGGAGPQAPAPAPRVSAARGGGAEGAAAA